MWLTGLTLTGVELCSLLRAVHSTAVACLLVCQALNPLSDHRTSRFPSLSADAGIGAPRQGDAGLPDAITTHMDM